MTGGVLGLCLRRLWLSAALCCAWLLRSATPGQSIEAPWPVATYPNGSVVLNALDNGILLVPKEGHAVEVQGDLLVQGVSVLSSLTPPLCQGAHEKLVYNGTAWACVCESSWGGPGCDVYQSTRVCGALARLFSFELDFGEGGTVLLDDITDMDVPLVAATGLPWSTSQFVVSSVTSNTTDVSVEWIPSIEKVRVTKYGEAQNGDVNATLSFAGRIDGLGDNDAPCLLRAQVQAVIPAPPPPPDPALFCTPSSPESLHCAFIDNQCWCKGNAEIYSPAQVCGIDSGYTGTFHLYPCDDATYNTAMGISGTCYENGNCNTQVYEWVRVFLCLLVFAPTCLSDTLSLSTGVRGTHISVELQLRRLSPLGQCLGRPKRARYRSLREQGAAIDDDLAV